MIREPIHRPALDRDTRQRQAVPRTRRACGPHTGLADLCTAINTMDPVSDRWEVEKFRRDGARRAARLQSERGAERRALRGQAEYRSGPGRDCTAGAGRSTRAPAPTRHPPCGHLKPSQSAAGQHADSEIGATGLRGRRRLGGGPAAHRRRPGRHVAASAAHRPDRDHPLTSAASSRTYPLRPVKLAAPRPAAAPQAAGSSGPPGRTTAASPASPPLNSTPTSSSRRSPPSTAHASSRRHGGQHSWSRP
jgi:hypothetical protein